MPARWVFTTQRVGDELRHYYRCLECAREWTVVENVTDLHDPVTTGEQIEVHRALAKEGITMDEIVNPRRDA